MQFTSSNQNRLIRLNWLANRREHELSPVAGSRTPTLLRPRRAPRTLPEDTEGEDCSHSAPLEFAPASWGACIASRPRSREALLPASFGLQDRLSKSVLLLCRE